MEVQNMTFESEERDSSFFCETQNGCSTLYVIFETVLIGPSGFLIRSL